jgi:ribosome-associated protein
VAIALARTAVENRCQDVLVLNLTGISPVTDFFVIATGTSGRQMKTVIAKMNDFVRHEPGVSALGEEGLDSQRWVLLDLVDIVVHIFAPDARSYYALELLWGDAPKIDWQAGYTPPRPLAPVTDDVDEDEVEDEEEE